MTNCHQCKYWDKEFIACMKEPYEIDEVSCLLKNILAVLLCQQNDDSDEDFWKK